MSGQDKSISVDVLGNVKPLQKELDEGSSSLENFSKKAAGLGSKIAGGLADIAKIGIGTALGGTIGENLIGGLGQALGQGQITSKLNAQLGGNIGADLGKVAGQLYADNFGESVESNADALRAVWQQGLLPEDATNEQIERVAGKVINLSGVFEQDLGGATAAVGNIMRNGLAPDADAALDIITRGFQQGVDKSGDLLDTMNEYSPQFAQLGLSGEQAMGLLSQGLKGGARDADTVADALKEFAIRAQDGSATTADGFKRLGLAGSDMSAKIAKGGPEAAAALDQTLDKLRAIKDPAEQSQIAVELFGTKAEDLQDALYSLDPSAAVQSLGDVAGAADKMGEAISADPMSKLQAFGRMLQGNLTSVLTDKVMPAVLSFGESFTNAFSGNGWEAHGPIETVGVALGDFARDILPKLKAAWDSAFEGIKSGLEWLGDHKEILIGIAAAISTGLVVAFGMWAASAASAAIATLTALAPIILIGAAIAALVAGIIWAYNNWGFFRDAVNAVKDALLVAVQWVITNVPPMWEMFVAGAQQVVAVVVPIIQGFVEWVQSVIPKLSEAFFHVWNVISTIVSVAMNVIWTIVQVVWDIILNIWNAVGANIMDMVGTVWNWIVATITTVINIVKNVIEFVLNLINGDWGAAWDNIKNILGSVWNWILNTIGAVLSIITQVIGSALSIIGGIFSGAWDWIKGIVGGAWDWIRSTVSGGVDALVGFIRDLPGRISGFFGGMWNGIVDSFRGAINGMIGLWNNLSFTFPSAEIFGQTVGGWTLGTPDIPYLAEGGHITGSGSVIVGEAGPELLTLDAGARVTPLNGSGVGGMTVVVNVGGSVVTENELVQSVRDEFVKIMRRNGTLNF